MDSKTIVEAKNALVFAGCFNFMTHPNHWKKSAICFNEEKHPKKQVFNALASHQIAVVDDMQVLLAKIQGEFVWHQHEEEDELFYSKGNLGNAVQDRGGNR